MIFSTEIEERKQDNNLVNEGFNYEATFVRKGHCNNYFVFFRVEDDIFRCVQLILCGEEMEIDTFIHISAVNNIMWTRCGNWTHLSTF